MVGNTKAKSKYVKEVCYKFVDQNEKTTGYYNGEGDLIESRPAKPHGGDGNCQNDSS